MESLQRQQELAQQVSQLCQQVTQMAQQQSELRSFVQRQARRQDKQFSTLMNYIYEVFVQRIPAPVIPPSLQQPLQFNDPNPPPADNNDNAPGRT